MSKTTHKVITVVIQPTHLDMEASTEHTFSKLDKALEDGYLVKELHQCSSSTNFLTLTFILGKEE